MRTRVDGHKFEDEFEKAMKDEYYVLRLHTLGMGYSGLTQPADFILFGEEATNFIELKETGKDRFNMSEIQQLDEIVNFINWRERFKPKYKLNYYVIVHFLTYNKIRVVTAEQVVGIAASGKSLREDSGIGIEIKDLKELKGLGIL